MARPYFRNNPILLLPFLDYTDDIVVSSGTCPGMNAVCAKHVLDSDAAPFRLIV